jgi:hypothetical protein
VWKVIGAAIAEINLLFYSNGSNMQPNKSLSLYGLFFTHSSLLSIHLEAEAKVVALWIPERKSVISQERNKG